MTERETNEQSSPGCLVELWERILKLLKVEKKEEEKDQVTHLGVGFGKIHTGRRN